MLRAATPCVVTVREAQVKGDHTPSVKLVQELADLAQRHGVRSPCTARELYVETRRRRRIAAKAKRANLGPHQPVPRVHERVGDKLDETLRRRSARDVVSITGWTSRRRKYVTRLDHGDFDVVAYLAKLQAAGYKGPIASSATT